jgi:hypothetical protein
MNATTTTHSFTSLKPRQQAFVTFLVNDCGVTNTSIKREDLQIHSVAYGLGSPPAWIVRDESRRSKRAYYEIPEIADYMNQRSGTA